MNLLNYGPYFLLLFCILSACQSKPSSPTDEIKSKYTLVFEDNFDSGRIDTIKWRTSTGMKQPYDRVLPRNNCNFEKAAYLLDSNLVLKDGVLNLIARHEKFRYSGIAGGKNGAPLSCDFEGGKLFDLDLNFTSASISGKKGFKHGYFECRAKMPSAIGLYPVFWLWHHDEIVVFEFFGNSKSHFMSAHKKDNYVTKHFEYLDYSDDFHVYAVDWTPENITWYFDDKELWKISRIENIGLNKERKNTIAASFPDSLNRWLRPNVSLRMYEWAEHIATENLPDTLQIDYVRIYQKE